MRNKNNSYLLSLFVVFAMVSCQSDSANFAPDTLKGKWNIEQAFRDGKETQTLKKGYFEFSDEQKLKTNILRDTLFYNYVLKGSKIKVDDTHKISYTVSKLIADTLILETKIRKFDFRIILLKAVDEELLVQ